MTKGFCKYCGKEFTRGGMLRHLSACKERKLSLESQETGGCCGYYQVTISEKYGKDYWLIIEVNENASLEDLDIFIRNIWVECCGHLSEFQINGVRYEANPSWGDCWGESVKSMDCKLKKVFEPGTVAEYEYDFGSTTSLKLQVNKYRTGKQKNEKLTILSRNNPPEIMCEQCGERHAEWVNPLRFYEGDGFWCGACMRKKIIESLELDESYELDESDVYESFDLILPVCNSPRMGVCVYEGSELYPDQFVPDIRKREKESQ